MQSSWLGLMKEIEQLIRQVEKGDFSKHVLQPLAQMWNSPRVNVQILNEGLRVFLEAPDISSPLGKTWATKVVGRQLMIRGQRVEESTVTSDSGKSAFRKEKQSFMKVIPLPFEIKSKPSSVKYENGLVILDFQRKQFEEGERWIPIK